MRGSRRRTREVSLLPLLGLARASSFSFSFSLSLSLSLSLSVSLSVCLSFFSLMALINLLHFCYVGIGGNKLCGWGDEEEEVGRDGGAGRSDEQKGAGGRR